MFWCVPVFLRTIVLGLPLKAIYTMQSDELAHLSKVYSVFAGTYIPIFHCILNNSA